MALKIGSKAPDFVLPSTSGKLFKLSENWKGNGGIIYFYPKDFTSGCTAQACEFRDEFASFRDLDVPIIGISKDSIATHQKFKKEFNLPFELLGDTRGSVCRSYDALIPLVNLPKRITYLLDENHVIRAAYQDMFDSKSHIREMIAQITQA